jgi:hypothetical protein
VKRLRVPGLIDLFEVSDPAEIKALASDPRLDRRFETGTCPIYWLLLKRSLMALSFEGRRFPTMMPRGSGQRKLDQQELWTSRYDRRCFPASDQSPSVRVYARPGFNGQGFTCEHRLIELN